ncbi:MAG: amidohydrolase family protein, partial [Chitinophagaceae bacterium]
MRILFLFAALVFIVSCKQQADIVYVNAKIWTGDSSRPAASVLAVKNGMIVYVGDDASNLAAGQIVDLGGKLMLPGFTDNHTHFLSAGYGLSSVKLKDAMTKQEFISRIAE